MTIKVWEFIDFDIGVITSNRDTKMQLEVSIPKISKIHP